MKSLALLSEADQGLIDLVGVSPADGVRPAADDLKLAVGKQGGQPLAGVGEGQDTVGVALNDEDRNIDPGQIGAEIRLPGRDTGDDAGGRSADGDIPARLVSGVADQ